MFNLKEKLDATLQAAIWGAMAAAAGIATMFFLCVAVFVWTERNYGTITASLVMAAAFLVIATGAAIALLHNRRVQAQRDQARSVAVSSKWWLEPAMIAAGLQVARTVGARPVFPLLVLVTFVAGWIVSRSTASENPAPPS